ncbi:MAG: peptide chain release factor N(5)-glutamine methyltransferase [Spirochaetales bacterium]|nr:peptide chain release factor N(5)-glutamine methyltransferase [Spirochaetales bacterium]
MTRPPPSPNLGTFVADAARRLPDSTTPRLDVFILIEKISGLSRGDVLAELRRPVDAVLSPEGRKSFDADLEKRARGLPVAYIVGHKEFYGRDFAVGPGALVPRPETEHLVECALELARSQSEPLIHDCCTGTGCIGITVARECLERGQAARVVLSDLHEEALEWARRNAHSMLGGEEGGRYRLEIRDLLEEPGGAVRHDAWPAPTIITANPPYLTTTESAAALARGWDEPASALDGGADGLDLYPCLARQAFESLARDGYFLVEHGAGHAERVVEMLLRAGFTSPTVGRDLSGTERFVVGQKSRAAPVDRSV